MAVTGEAGCLFKVKTITRFTLGLNGQARLIYLKKKKKKPEPSLAVAPSQT